MPKKAEAAQSLDWALANAACWALMVA